MAEDQSTAVEEKIDVKVIVIKPIAKLLADPRNARVHNEENIEAIKDSLRRFGQQKPIVIEEGGRIIAGNGTLEAARQLGWRKVATTKSSLTDLEADAYGIADNRSAELASWNDEALAATLRRLEASGDDLSSLHFPKDELDRLLARLPPPDEGPKLGGLSDRFLMPPFSVLDARQGYWQDRKRAWIALGIASQVGRGENLLNFSDAVTLQGKLKPKTLGALPPNEKELKTMAKGEDSGEAAGAGTSIFDPVLCELAYMWFSAPDARVLDPFAGGSVRGIVAAKLGRKYLGIDLRPEQIAANKAQADAVFDSVGMRASVNWECGDSLKVLDSVENEAFDLIMSCPPYADLEVYSSDPADISNMPYKQFLAAYSSIIAKSIAKLKPNRFAFWVIGDVREPKGGGFYRGFVPDTIRAFEEAGARLYNEAILVTSVGTLPLRTPRIFAASRKLGKTHQNVLVFCKGDPMKAAKACGEVEVWQPSAEDLAEAEALPPAIDIG